MNRRWWGGDGAAGPLTRRRYVVRLLTTRGFLPVRVCRRCAALVLGTGVDQHERAHRADGQARRDAT